jgi:hypothetical protein
MRRFPPLVTTLREPSTGGVQWYDAELELWLWRAVEQHEETSERLGLGPHPGTVGPTQIFFHDPDSHVWRALPVSEQALVERTLERELLVRHEHRVRERLVHLSRLEAERRHEAMEEASRVTQRERLDKLEALRSAEATVLAYTMATDEPVTYYPDGVARRRAPTGPGSGLTETHSWNRAQPWRATDGPGGGLGGETTGEPLPYYSLRSPQGRKNDRELGLDRHGDGADVALPSHGAALFGELRRHRDFAWVGRPVSFERTVEYTLGKLEADQQAALAAAGREKEALAARLLTLEREHAQAQAVATAQVAALQVS